MSTTAPGKHRRDVELDSEPLVPPVGTLAAIDYVATDTMSVRALARRVAGGWQLVGVDDVVPDNMTAFARPIAAELAQTVGNVCRRPGEDLSDIRRALEHSLRDLAAKGYLG